MRRLIGRRILDMSKAKFLLPIIALMSLSACSSNNPVSSTFDPIINDPIFVDHSLNKPNKSFNNQHQKLKEEYVSSLNEFALDFYSAISSKENSVFSPVSIATCYSMLYDGALENSKEELKKMLHFGDSFNHLEEIQKMLLNTAINDAKNGVTLDLAQSLWIDDDFAPRINQEYVSKMEEYYYAEAYQGALDSDEMHAMLADYINKKTNNFLNVKKEDFEEYEGVLWLLNTIYFKSKWVHEFPTELNYDGFFLNINNRNSDVTFMTAKIESHYYKAENYMISSIPYNNGFNMSILLPNYGTDYSKVLNDKSAVSALLNYYNTRNHISDTITYSIPQFKIQESYDLKKVLPNLGAIDIFDDDRANLFGLVEDGAAKGNLYVGRSKHEAGIEVNNEGSEAAAYTIIEVDEKAAYPSDEVVFNVNRPFTYLISSSDGLPLFMGTINSL